MTVTDFDLVAAWRSGDNSAGQELFERHYERVYRFFDSKIGEDTTDLVGDTFSSCLSEEAQVGDAGAFRLLVLRTARAKLYGFLTQRCWADRSLSADPTAMTTVEMGGAPTTLVEDVPEGIRLALTQIPLESQLILELHMTEDLSHRQLAYVFEVSEPDIGERIRAAQMLFSKRMLAVAKSRGAHA